MKSNLRISPLFVLCLAIFGVLASFRPVLALPMPSGELLLAEFRVSRGEESVPLSEWNWSEPWLSPNLEGNILAFSQVDGVADEDTEKDDANFASNVLESAGSSAASISPATFIANSKVEGFTLDVEILSSKFKMFNIFEAPFDPNQPEYTFSFRYGWLFDNGREPDSNVEIAAGISLESLFDPLDSFSFGISNLGGAHERRNLSGRVSSSFAPTPGVPYVFTLWGATQWSGDGALEPLPVPAAPDNALLEENAPVPEPNTLFLFLLGFSGFFLWSRRSPKR